MERNPWDRAFSLSRVGNAYVNRSKFVLIVYEIGEAIIFIFNIEETILFGVEA